MVLFVSTGSLGVSCVVLEFCICFISQDRMLASVDSLIMRRLCDFVRPCAVVAPFWSSKRSTRNVAMGSCNVLLEYMRPGPGMPCFRQNV